MGWNRFGASAPRRVLASWTAVALFASAAAFPGWAAAGSFPVGCPFTPPIADPKTPRFMMSVLRAEKDQYDTTVWAVSFGETVGIYRWAGGDGDEGLQAGIAAAVFAQFDLEAPSSDLINADYVIGIPLEYRRGWFSSRLRVYHQSSHLGDEYLMRVHPERVNLSFESVEALISGELSAFRAYAGGEYLFHREPADLDPWIAHGGVDYRGPVPLLALGDLADVHPLAGFDVRMLEQNGWTPGWSMKAGFEFRARGPGRRRFLRFLVEYYDGPSPYGQFYEEQVNLLGASVQVGF